MKRFRTLIVLHTPADSVWSVMQNRLSELAAMIDDIQSVVTLEREELAPGRKRLVNEWRVRQQVPELLRGALGSSELGWIDRNTWDEPARVRTWAIEPFVLTGSIDCHGTTSYEPAIGGRGCRVIFDGAFDLTDSSLSRLARPLQRPAAAFMELIVTTLIPRNTRMILEAAARVANEDTRR